MEKSKIRIAIGSDHAGFHLKEAVKDLLLNGDYIVEDYGTFSDASVDYPDFAHPVAAGVNKGLFSFGVLICGSGNGVSITANKYTNVRAALCWNTEIAKLARLHNNANIIALPARFIDNTTALNAVMIFLNTVFESGRHQKRIEKISNMQL